MLVLTRRANEQIVIGDEIVVTVLEVRGDRIRLGIQAPASTQVHRREIWKRIQAEQPNIHIATSSVQAPCVYAECV
jgi:carbon storage regulator